MRRGLEAERAVRLGLVRAEAVEVAVRHEQEEAKAVAARSQGHLLCRFHLAQSLVSSFPYPFDR